MKKKKVDDMTKEEFKKYVEELNKRIEQGDDEALDEKFELMSRECAESMTGTGTGLKKETKEENN